MKIGCIVYVQLPAILRPCYQQWRKQVLGKSDDGIPPDGLLVLFMN